MTLALFNAIENGQLDVIHLILRDNPELVTVRDDVGKTLLLYAVLSNDVAIVLNLIKYGADVNVKDNNGLSPLQQAILDGRTEIAKYLIEFGADVNEIDAKGKSLCGLAIDNDNEHIVKMPIEHGVVTHKPISNSVTIQYDFCDNTEHDDWYRNDNRSNNSYWHDDDYHGNNWEEKRWTEKPSYFDSRDPRLFCPECQRREPSVKYFPLCCTCYYKQTGKSNEERYKQVQGKELKKSKGKF